MARQTSKRRRSRFAELLIPFREAYLQGQQATRGSRFKKLVHELEELAEGTDVPALHARVNLADYYRVMGDTSSALKALESTMKRSAPEPILYAADMMAGSLYLSSNPEQALGAFRDAALVSSDRESFAAAYDGLGMSIASAARVEPDCPTILVDNLKEADTFWSSQASLHVDRWWNIGRWRDVNLAFPRIPGEAPTVREPEGAVMGIIDDDDLIEKRRILWEGDPFQVVISVRRTRRWDRRPSGVIQDRWGNSVKFQ